MWNLNLNGLALHDIDVEAVVVDDSYASVTGGSDSLDCIIILQSKEQILWLFERPQPFWQLGMIHGSMVPQILRQYWVHFDCIQVSAIGDENKRAVIIGADHFLKNHSTRMNILCTDDVRVREEFDNFGNKIWAIHQATRCQPGLVINHEGYTVSSDLCETPRTIYSRTARQLLYNSWFVSKPDVQSDIKRFLKTLGVRMTPPAHTGPSTQIDYGSEGCHSNLFFSHYDYTYCRDVKIYEKLVSQLHNYETEIVITPQEKETSRTRSRMARNSDFGVISAELGNDMRLYWKDSKLDSAANDHEFQGAEGASEFYPFVQRPMRAQGGEIVYPFFNGRSQFEERARYIANSRVDVLLRNWILEVELRKVEDILRASLQSFRTEVGRPSNRIERLFHNIVQNGNESFREHYKSGVKCGGKVVPPEEFLNAPIIVNNIRYPSLAELIAEAETVLQPDNRPEGYIYGFGDCHGGNILVENTNKPLGYRKILYIDYEFAGFHSPILDFCNPFYIDVFFEIVHPARTDHRIGVTALFENGTLEISLSGPMDELGSAILEIKALYLLAPLCSFLESRGMDTSKIYKQIASALFVCGLFKFAWGGSWQEFFLRVAVGVVSSQVVDLTTLRNLWRSLIPTTADQGVIV